MFRPSGVRMQQLVNQLAKSRNPYLLSHKTNPVAWQEWTPKALQLAADENKPVFLSIGYHSCHCM